MPPAGFNPITVADERGRGPCVEDARCADCSAADVSWASSNLGVLLCTACAGCHRALGPQISRVRSCSLDSWTDALCDLVETLHADELHMDERASGEGPASGPNAIWEALLPTWVNRPPPSDGADPGSLEDREAFTRLKYQRRDFCQMAAGVLGVDSVLDARDLVGKGGVAV